MIYRISDKLQERNSREFTSEKLWNGVFAKKTSDVFENILTKVLKRFIIG